MVFGNDNVEANNRVCENNIVAYKCQADASGSLSNFKAVLRGYGFVRGLVEWEKVLREQVLNIILPQFKLDIYIDGG